MEISKAHAMNIPTSAVVLDFVRGITHQGDMTLMSIWHNIKIMQYGKMLHDLQTNLSNKSQPTITYSSLN